MSIIGSRKTFRIREPVLTRLPGREGVYKGRIVAIINPHEAVIHRLYILEMFDKSWPNLECRRVHEIVSARSQKGQKWLTNPPTT